MASEDKSTSPPASKGSSITSQDTPAWADGLKQLYDDVVEEPLPDAFKDLLAQLDDTNAGASSAPDGEAAS